MGMNAIVLYLGHQIGWRLLPFHFAVGTMNTHWIHLVESLWTTSLWMFVAFVMFKKNAFVVV
eukprot:TCALIF_08091-PA protein Name:"Similar to Hgsnat Heparan-alpha-glucosaminide N-acetyltransferase (Mus musculus)" AED:0.47 eAED:0.49 QI:0/0/0/1/1/1/2/0/61